MSLKYFLYLNLVIAFYTSHAQICIMLDTIGNTKKPGRSIDGAFERGLAIQCIRALEHELNNDKNKFKIITPEFNDHDQFNNSAILANRIQPDLYLTFGFYHEESKPCHWTMYYYQENITDSWHQSNALMFYPISKAHLLNFSKTKTIAEQIFGILQSPNSKIAGFTLGLFGIPIKPLCNLQTPCLYFEAGLYQKSDWQLFVKPLSNAINDIFS